MKFLRGFVILLLILMMFFMLCTDEVLAADLGGHYESMNFFVHAPTNRKAKLIGKKAEKYYKELLKKLRYGGMLKKKCHIYIYSNRNDYLADLHAKGIDLSWSTGVHLDKRYYGYPVVSSYLQDDLLTRILPHELTHAIFKEFILGMRTEKHISIPLWIDEGMAVYMQKKSNYKRITKTAVKKGDYIRLKELIYLGYYPESNKEICYFYAQAPSLVDFLLVKYSGAKFLSFARKMTFSNKSPGDILITSYYGKIKNINHLQRLWIEYVKNNY